MLFVALELARLLQALQYSIQVNALGAYNVWKHVGFVKFQTGEVIMIKDILVHLQGNDEDQTRLAFAKLIANQHSAFITGIFTNLIPENRFVAGDGSMMAAQATAEMRTKAKEDGDKMETLLSKSLQNLGLESELRRIDITLAMAGNALAKEARTADLMIATRPYDHYTATPEMLEDVLFNSGRGVLFAPPSIKPNGNIDHVVVAWRNTRESARAISGALPILVDAKNVTIAMVTERSTSHNEDDMPGADIARHLVRHGINVDIRHIKDWSNPAEALLNEVEKTGSKLLVMGGYGHSRFREWVLGGVTRDVLSKAQVPVFMSH